MHALAYGAVTDRGSVRAINEDSILAQPPVFVVADGIGGNEAGEVASAIVVEEFTALAQHDRIDPDDVAATLETAHQRVRSLHQGRPFGACTTAVGAVAIEDGPSSYWVVFNVGDSRIYQRGAGEGTLRQISVDHSHVQELVDAGLITAERALTHPERHVVTRAVGSDDGCVPDFWVLPMVPGDRLVICSDGLFGDTAPDELEAISATAGPPTAVADLLLAAALRDGARDNVSVVVVDVLADQRATGGSDRQHDHDGHGPGANDHEHRDGDHRTGDHDGADHESADHEGGDHLSAGAGEDDHRDERDEHTVRIDRDGAGRERPLTSTARGGGA